MNEYTALVIVTLYKWTLWACSTEVERGNWVCLCCFLVAYS